MSIKLNETQVSDHSVQVQAPDSFFWRISSKWYFLPIFYAMLVLLFVLVVSGAEFYRKGSFSDLEEFAEIFLLSTYFLPNGLLLIIPEAKKIIEEELFLVFPAIFHAFWIVSTIVIQIFKYKRKKILRWLVITVFVAMIISFVGCTQFIITQKDLGLHF